LIVIAIPLSQLRGQQQIAVNSSDDRKPTLLEARWHVRRLRPADQRRQQPPAFTPQERLALLQQQVDHDRNLAEGLVRRECLYGFAEACEAPLVSTERGRPVGVEQFHESHNGGGCHAVKTSSMPPS
jgi:hypothetical protein